MEWEQRVVANIPHKKKIIKKKELGKPFNTEYRWLVKSDRMDAKGREAQQSTAGVKVSWGDEAREIVGKK